MSRLEGVYYNGNGGYVLPGETRYHMVTECPVVRQNFAKMEYLADVTALQPCPKCQGGG